MSDHAKPIPLALIVCDQIYVDRATKKRTLLGMFDMLRFMKYPSPPIPFCVHCSVTEYTGKVPLVMRIIDSEELRPPVCEHLMPLPQEMNPLATVECDLRMDKLSFPERGEYRVQILAEGVTIIERRLRLYLMVKDPPEPK